MMSLADKGALLEENKSIERKKGKCKHLSIAVVPDTDGSIFVPFGKEA
jgi:hypothetical protein